MKERELTISNSGITLVALIITIIVLLILAGVSISFVFNGGILDKSQQAADEYEKSAEEEENLLADVDSYLDKKINNLTGNRQEYDTVKNVNKPKLEEGMIPVKYDEGKGKWVITNENDNEWYDYDNKQWANIMLSDGKYKTSNAEEYKTDGTTEIEISDLGSMFVWIPRYAYKITSGYHSSNTGTIEVKFLIGTTNETVDKETIVDYNAKTTNNYTKFPDGYVVHPAFTNKVSVGGWDKEITGIWVSKFEAGYPMEGSIDFTAKSTSNLYFPVFKGQRYSYNKVSFVNMYEMAKTQMCSTGNPYGINSKSNSHMIKNSEWGAVAYLATSTKGKNSEVYINNLQMKNTTSIAGISVAGVTGYSAGELNSTNNYLEGNLAEEMGTSKVSTVWYKPAGYEASTTGNITGIYDMSGGNWDYTANVIQSGFSGIPKEISSIRKSNKYITLYPLGNSNETEVDIGRSYSAWGEMYGDGIWEVSNGYRSSSAWFGDCVDKDGVGSEPFFFRGDCFTSGNVRNSSRSFLHR